MKTKNLLALLILVSIESTQCINDAPKRKPFGSLFEGAKENKPEYVKFALNNGVHIDILYRGRLTDSFTRGASALHTAIRYNHPEMVEFLLNQNANPDIIMRMGYPNIPQIDKFESSILESTPLIFSILRGYDDITKILIEKSKANINKQTPVVGATALMWAVNQGNQRIVELLLENGADINLRTSDGKTAMLIANEKGFANIEKILATEPERRKQFKLYTQKELSDKIPAELINIITEYTCPSTYRTSNKRRNYEN